MTQKHIKTNFKAMLVVLMLTLVMILTSFLIVFNQNKNKVYAVEWIDNILDSYAVESLGKAAPVYTVVTGTISLAGSIYKGVDAAVSAEDGDGAAAFFKAFIGGEGSSHAEIMKSLSDIKNSITEVSGKIDVINNKINSLCKKLDGITLQLNSMLNTITTELKTSVEQIKVNLYKSQLEMRNWATVYSQIDYFYNKYADVKTTLQTDLKTLNDRHADYEEFLRVAYSQGNGEEIKAVVNKLGLNYEKSYATLTEAERALLDTTIISKGHSSKVGKYVSDYTTYLYNYLKGSYQNFASGYSTNMYMTFLNMADYILGKKTLIGSGIGEVFYKLAIMGSSNSIEVHDSYKQFMSNVISDFMLTGYVCNLSLQMQANYLEAYDQNVSEIQTYNDYVENIQNVILKVLAYTDYEYQKCINDYDINGFVPQIGYDVDDYIVYYGNTVNYLKNGDDKTRYVLKQDYSKNELFVNESYIFLASGERFETKVYYHNQECQSNFEWVSSNQSVAIVSQNGVITGIAQGDAIISVKLKNSETLYPVVAVSVSNAYVTSSGTENNVYDYGGGTFVCAGKGLTYNYGATIYAFVNSFDTSKYQTTSISSTLGLNQSECEKFDFSTTNRNIKINGDVAQATIKTSGVITGVQNINGTKVVLQLPVVGEVALEPVKETITEDTSATDANTIYIYTKEQLLDWRAKADVSKPSEDIKNKNIKLMADIDFEWGVWETCTEECVDRKTFDGNGHEIKNITFKGAKYSWQKDNISYYGLFANCRGVIKNLTINNVAFTPPDEEDDSTLRAYGIFGYRHHSAVWTVGDNGLEQVQLDGNIYNCVLKGEARINTKNSFVFAPFTGLVSSPNNLIHCSIVKNCIYDMNLIVDCQGSDLTAQLFGFYNDIEGDWSYKENFLGRYGANNLFTGSMRVINIADTSKVQIDRFYKYNTDIVDATINQCLFYYPNSICSATNTQGQTIEFSNEGRGNCVSYDQSISSEFWASKGFDYYDISNVIAQYSIPLTPKKYLHADFHNFKSVYALNEELDMANLKIYDQANTDITNLVQFSSIDKTTPGKKTITATYQTETISFEVEYVEYQTLPDRHYTIIFNNYDNSLISSNEYIFNEEIKVPTAPTREQDNGYIYEFAGWDTEVVRVNGNKTYTATYTPIAKTYTIEFDLNGGLVRADYTLKNVYTYSVGLSLPDSNNIYKFRYKFIGWTLTNNKTDDNYITSIGKSDYGNKTYYAQYEKIFDITTIAEKQIVKTDTSNLKNGVDLTDLFNSEKDNDSKVLIESENISIEFNNEAVKQLGSQDELVFKFGTGNVEDYKNCYLVLELSINNKQFNSGNVTIAYDLTNIQTSGKNVKVYYVNEDNTRTDMNAIFADNKVTFTTNHFSTYIIAEEQSPSLLIILIVSTIIVVFIGAIIVIKFLVKRKNKNKKFINKI